MTWQPIETAPKDGTRVLLFFGGVVIEGHYWSFKDGGEWCAASVSQHGCGCCSDDSDKPTHWMPLPEPPKESA